ncbi:ribose-phosphate diphosphokinase [Wenzhouxiangella marina]|uniref:ribose-phosphate diphosphokinase n=1 Tax=Wenzhouxiangella marina TaxID=1579979 RepID=A0A0K0XRT3_9GAMM|nr:ribose-phosphate diphosphokinase [Wenzhouxiangella marina]AKS40403.1 Phosphoribosylpyrophosphate synthetase [Wenzhouxiangella marina]MBB6088275.1 ribose-phosphate pyrophosphokinase [Wenzhouxiangella marina]
MDGKDLAALSLIALPGNEPLAHALSEQLDAPLLDLEFRRFPDGESYLRLDADLSGRRVALVATLDRPDDKIPGLLFTADLCRDLGAERVGLICPYLPYMRQDCRFHPGEALTSRSFARWLSDHLDWLVTVDPHLHRYHSLDEIYALDSEVVAAAPALGDWIAGTVDNPLVIGPDGESEQWVRAVAEPRQLPWRVMSKVRHGDRDVEQSVPDLDGFETHTPVLVDDIISSGATVAEATRHLLDAGLPAPVVVAVHGLFGDRSRELLRHAGVARVVCTNSVNAPESDIGLSSLLVPAIQRLA